MLPRKFCDLLKIIIVKVGEKGDKKKKNELYIVVKKS